MNINLGFVVEYIYFPWCDSIFTIPCFLINLEYKWWYGFDKPIVLIEYNEYPYSYFDSQIVREVYHGYNFRIYIFIPYVYSNSQDSWYHSCWVFLFGEKLIYAVKDMSFDLWGYHLRKPFNTKPWYCCKTLSKQKKDKCVCYW